MIEGLIITEIVLYILRLLLCTVVVVTFDARELKEDLHLYNMEDVVYFTVVPFYMPFYVFKLVKIKILKLK